MESELFQQENHSFIIRIWRETITESPDINVLRGHITHVPSEARQYIQKLDDITLFIEPYMGKMGIQFE
jgi:hypothetical protein